jgi:ribonuclease G
MAKELIVSINGREKKIAIIENDNVTEFYIERGEENQGIVGNIYKGRVMRVLPGMQSAFVDIGLERDAFLYVSDFFDEEEEFERIVIDKAKKGETDAEQAAAEQIALARVEREHRIEATHERAEPLLEDAARPHAAPSETQRPRVESEHASDLDEAGRRRGRRGRRRGRGRDGADAQFEHTGQRAQTPAAEDIRTPFVESDPSIERIVDDEETATATGEMFKDARLQERIFDQIHAIEFEDDFRSAEVGSLIPAGGYRDESFQRIDDGDVSQGSAAATARTHAPIEAHLESFVDNVSEDTLTRGTFERVSDDEEPDTARANARSARQGSEIIAAGDGEPVLSPVTKRRGARKSAAAKSSKSKTASRKTSSKRPVKNAAEDATDDSEAAAISNSQELAENSEARITSSRSRGEFATRRGGRRRRRPTKGKPAGAAAETVGANGKDEETEVSPPPEEITSPTLTPQPLPSEPVRTSEPARDRAPSPRSHRGSPRRDRDRNQPAITDLLKEGQEILVQIAKEPIAKKGARITSHIALPGRFLVYMPTVEHVGVSRKIESDTERHRLRKLIQLIRAEEDIPSGGFIVRTAGVGMSEKGLREDVRYLVRTWLDIRAAAEKAKPATLVHRDLDLVQRILRDQLSDDFAAIRVDSEDEYERIVDFVNRINPGMVKRVKLYTRDEPILEKYGVQAEIDKAIKPRVWLRSGGYLVINQTEALVAIDVNTGKFVGRGSGRLEDTITRTNMEAVDEIVRQIRLRDLGGIIVLDLIDMEERRNRTRVMQALQDALRSDKSPTKVLSFNDFGLVIMTRKRVKQSLERTLCAPCQYCQGAGLIKSPQTICYELLEEARRLGKSINGDKGNKQATLRINPEVGRALRGSERDVLNEIEEYLGPVDINSDPTVHQEQFDFAFI